MAPTTSVLLDPSNSDDEENTSLIYAVLPPLLKRSMPKVRSLRRSLSGYNCAAALVGHGGRYTSIDSGGSRRGSSTPPPPYQEPIASLTSVLTDEELQSIAPPIPARPLALDASVFANSERTGLKWEFASQGLGLVQSSSCLPTNPSFSRQLYIDGLSYLLRGLPPNLSEQETLRLRAAIPSSLHPSPSPSPQPLNHIMVPRTPHQTAQPEQTPTLLHRAIATTVLQLFLLASFLWPYVRSTCQHAYAYERQHRIAERVVSGSWVTANTLSKNGMSLARAVCAWNDGQVGAALEDVMVWWVQGVTGGLVDGVRDGIEVVGLRSHS